MARAESELSVVVRALMMMDRGKLRRESRLLVAKDYRVFCMVFNLSDTGDWILSGAPEPVLSMQHQQRSDSYKFVVQSVVPLVGLTHHSGNEDGCFFYICNIASYIYFFIEATTQYLEMHK